MGRLPPDVPGRTSPALPLTGPWKGLRLQVAHPSPLSRVSAKPGRRVESLKSQVKEERDG